jgi:hypothetical protein
MSENNEELRRRIREFPVAGEAIYKMAGPNEDVELYSGDIIVKKRGGSNRKFVGTGRVFLKWLPRPKVRARFKLEIDGPSEQLLNFFGSPDLELNLSKLDRRLIVQLSSGSGSVFEGTVVQELLGNTVRDKTRLNRIRFHLPNFGSFNGEPIRYQEPTVYRDKLISCARMILTSDRWNIVIDDLPEAQGLRRTLKVDGGFAFSCVGEITSSTESLDITEAKNVLEAYLFTAPSDQPSSIGWGIGVGAWSMGVKRVRWSSPF